MGLRPDVAVGPLGVVAPGGVWYTTVGLVFALAALAGTMRPSACISAMF